MNSESKLLQGRRRDDEQTHRNGGAVTGELGCAVLPFRDRVSERVLEQRLRFLMNVLAEAQDEMAGALLAGDDAVVLVAAARRLSSVGWLFHDAADRFVRGRAS